MSDDTKKTGKADRDRVSLQPHEVAAIAEKKDLPEALVRNVIKQVGPVRREVEKYLDRMKENRK